MLERIAAAVGKPAFASIIRSEALAPLVWGIAALLSGLVVFALEPNVLEEGQLAHVAQRIAAGERLYRDIVYYTGPLPFELLAVLFRIFGDDLFVARLAMLPFMALAAACSFALARRSGAGVLAHVAGAIWASAPVILFPLLSIFFYTNLAFYLAPVACYAALRGREGFAWALAAGALVACIALCKQNFGVVFAVTLLAALLAGRSKLRPLLGVGAGGAAVALLCVVFYALRGDLDVFVYSVAVLPFELEGSFFAPFINFWPIGELTPEIRANAPLYLPAWVYLRAGILVEPGFGTVAGTQLLYALPFLSIAATLGAGALRRNVSAGAWIHLAALMMLASNLYPRGDWGHLVYVLPAALVQLLLLLPKQLPFFTEKSAGELRRAAAATACLALYTGVIVVGTWVNTLARVPTFGPDIPLRPVSPSTRSKSIPRVIHYLRNRVYPQEPIFVARQEPLIYTATGTTNPTPYTGVVMGVRERQQREILAALEPVRFVVMSDIDQPLYAYYSDELPEVQRYLERHFRVPADFEIDNMSWIQVGARGPDLGVTSFDFIDERSQGRFWRRDRQGRVRAAPDSAPKLPSRQFRRLFAVGVGEGGGGVDFDVTLPEQALFESDTGLPWVVAMSRRHDHPGGARHALSISLDGASFQGLRTTRIADRTPRSAQRWQPFFFDLAPYAGRRVTLRLEVIPDAPLPDGAIVWWGSPRVARPEGGAWTQ